MKVSVDGVSINYHDAGTGEPVILLHGSGPGVSAAENWSRTLDVLADRGFRAIAPDVVGFGDSDRPEGFQYDARGWRRAFVGSCRHSISARPTWSATRWVAASR